MLNVLVKDTNEVIGFPDATDKNTVESVIRGDQYGEITQAKPNWYRDKIQPALEATGMSMFQPTFVGGTTAEPDATRAFMGTAVKDLSFGLINPMKNPVMAESAAEHPVAAFGGSLVGQTAAILTTAGLGKAIGFVGQAPELTKMGEAIVNNFKIGALYGAINSSVDQINKSIENNQVPDLIKVGADALKTAGVFSLYGAGGAASESIPVATATVAGMAYTISKIQGASEQDALLNAGTMGAFHFISSVNHPPEAQKAIMDGVDKMKADYIKSQAPQIHDAIVDRSAQEHTMMIKDELAAKAATPDAVAQPIEPTNQEVMAAQAKDILNIKEPPKAELPVFKNTEEALAYGKKVAAKPEVVQNLQDAYDKGLAQIENIRVQSDAAVKVGNMALSDQLDSEGFVLAQKNQLYREAVESAKANPPKVEITKGNKKSGLALSVEQTAIKEGLVKDFGNLPTYADRNMEEIAAKVSEFINNDYELAKKIALGEAPEQDGLRAQELFTGIRLKAAAEGDVNTLRELGLNEKASAMATELGQRVKALDSGDPNDPVRAIRELRNARQDALHKKMGKGKVAKETKSEVSNIKKSIRSVAKSMDWEGFVKSLEC